MKFRFTHYFLNNIISWVITFISGSSMQYACCQCPKPLLFPDWTLRLLLCFLEDLVPYFISYLSFQKFSKTTLKTFRHEQSGELRNRQQWRMWTGPGQRIPQDWSLERLQYSQQVFFNICPFITRERLSYRLIVIARGLTELGFGSVSPVKLLLRRKTKLGNTPKIASVYPLHTK